MLFALHQELGGEHRCKGQCGKRRDNHRTGYHNTEFAEQTSRHAVHEHNGEEHGNQRDGGGDYGAEYFCGSLDTRIFGTHPFLYADVDVLCHYNGIVHHQSHGKHHRQHGKHIDGEACQIHHEEIADERNRNHDARHQCHAPITQEEEDDNDNKHKSLVYRLLHLVDGGADKLGIVETVVVVDVFGQVFLHLFHAVVYGIGYFYVVGARLRNDYDTHHRHTVHLHITLDVGRTQFGTSYVAETDDTVAILFQDKVVELFCRMHQPQCADGEFGGISFDTAGGKFHIFLVYGILHIHGGDAVTGHLDGV